MLVFGIEAYWAAYAWKNPDPEMDWWEVYIIEGNELLVRFEVPIAQSDPFAYNIDAAPIMSRMRPDRRVKQQFVGPRCGHPFWHKLKARRGEIRTVRTHI